MVGSGGSPARPADGYKLRRVVQAGECFRSARLGNEGESVTAVGGVDHERLRVQLDCGHFVAVTGNRSHLLTTHIRCGLCADGSPLRRITSFLGPADTPPEGSRSISAIPAATCPACGGQVSYVPGQQLVCAACGRAEPVPSLASPPIHPYFALTHQLPETTAAPETFGADCPNCGSFQKPPDNQFACACNACGAPLNFLSQSTRVLKPQGILPVTVTKDAAYNLFRKWTRRRVFAPYRLRSKQADQLKLQYLPLFVFTGVVKAHYAGERGRTVKRGNQRRTSWTSVHGTLRWGLPATAVEVTSAKPKMFKPPDWPATEAVGLRQEYLLGATARSYMASPKSAEALIDNAVLKDAKSRAKNDIGGDKQRVNNVSVEYESLSLAYVLGPYWTSSFYDRGKTFTFRVNGRTGKTAGKYPKSKPRVTAAVAAAVAVVVLATIGIANAEHHNAVVTARSSVCSDIDTLWADLYPVGAQSPSTSGLAQMASTDSYTFSALQSDAKTAGSPYDALVQDFVTAQSAGQAGVAAAAGQQIAAACQKAGNGYLVTGVTTPAPGG